MMEEIMKNGPIVCSFEPPFDFMMYKSGVFHQLDSAQWIKSNMKKPEWEQVDHSVLCVGWGSQEDGSRYWIIQNTWGDDWGENG